MSLAKDMERGSHRRDRYNDHFNGGTLHDGSERNDRRIASPAADPDYEDPEWQLYNQCEWRDREEHQFQNIFDSPPTDLEDGTSEPTGEQVTSKIYSNAVTVDRFQGFFSGEEILVAGLNAAREKMVFLPVNSAPAVADDKRKKSAPGKGKSSPRLTQYSQSVRDGKGPIKHAEPIGPAIPSRRSCSPANAAGQIASIVGSEPLRNEGSSSISEQRAASPSSAMPSSGDNRPSEVEGNHPLNVAATAVKGDIQPTPRLVNGRCSECNKEIHLRQGDMYNWNRHIKDVHSDQRDCECPICQHRSSRKNNVAQHIRDMHLGGKRIQNKPPTTVKCPWCSKEFVYKRPALMMAHFEGRPPSKCLLDARAAMHAPQTSA